MNEQWEYKKYTIVDDSEDHEFMTQQDRLNHYGKKGWELVSVDNSVAYFKRLIITKPKEDPNRVTEYEEGGILADQESTYFD